MTDTPDLSVRTENTIFYMQQINLDMFGIKNNGTSPMETSIGLNKALQYAKEKAFSKIILPTGTYLVHENNPIVIDLKDTVIDLNGSTLQINTNGLEKYSIVEFRQGAENVQLINGTIRGDKDTHDYVTLKSNHEWGCGVIFKGGSNLRMDNVTVTNVTGYGISIESGLGNSNRFYTLYTRDVVQGSISEDGEMIASTTTTRTAIPYDISVCNGQFELGYTLGYLGYPYLLNRAYTAYFYNQDMEFIQKKECFQFRKVDVPVKAKYVYFVYPQATISSDRDYYAFISNFKPPTDSIIVDCLIKENRCLGIAVCGGQRWTIENNIFESNGGAAANYAVNFEDSFELIQDYIFRHNKFVNNNNDLVVCAGDNLVFEKNEFQKRTYFWERTTNYTVKGNKFNGGPVTYKIKMEGCDIRDNHYVNSNIQALSLSSLTISLTNETILDTTIDVSPGTKIIRSTINAARKSIKNAILENSAIEISFAEMANLTLKNCKIIKCQWNLHLGQHFETCEITDSIFSTHGDTAKIEFEDCGFVNSQLTYATWGAATETIFEQCEATITTNRPLVRLSAGKTRNLIFRKNTVTNQGAKPVIELYDTTYTVPNGNAMIEGNTFTQTNYRYVFDGANIAKGIFNFTDRNNSVIGAQMLNPRYVGNQYFNIIN